MNIPTETERHGTKNSRKKSKTFVSTFLDKMAVIRRQSGIMAVSDIIRNLFDDFALDGCCAKSSQSSVVFAKSLYEGKTLYAGAAAAIKEIVFTNKTTTSNKQQ